MVVSGFSWVILGWVGWYNIDLVVFVGLVWLCCDGKCHFVVLLDVLVSVFSLRGG